MNDYFRVYPTDIDFHARISNHIDSNPFDQNDPRYNEWIAAFNKHHKIVCENKSCCE